MCNFGMSKQYNVEKPEVEETSICRRKRKEFLFFCSILFFDLFLRLLFCFGVMLVVRSSRSSISECRSSI